jgi:hypothetical protein
MLSMMARTGLRALRSASAALLALTSLVPLAAAADDDRETAIANALAVQKAMLQGRELVHQFQYQAAVQVLESQIGRINGNREYLTLLRDAYRGYLAELRKDGKDAEAQRVQRRLQILDEPVKPEPALADKVPAKADSTTAVPQPIPQPVAPIPKPDAVRAQSEDPFQQEDPARRAKAQALVEQADKEFDGKHYAEAGRLCPGSAGRRGCDARQPAALGLLQARSHGPVAQSTGDQQSRRRRRGERNPDRDAPGGAEPQARTVGESAPGQPSQTARRFDDDR